MSRWIGRYAHFLSYVSCPKTQTFALRFLDSRRLLPSLTCHSSFEKAPKIECASLDWREESDAQPRGARRPGCSCSRAAYGQRTVRAFPSRCHHCRVLTVSLRAVSVTAPIRLLASAEHPKFRGGKVHELSRYFVPPNDGGQLRLRNASISAGSYHGGLNRT